ncbi:MAG: AMP-binding protein [SAR202 cluster bacterium]|nr:AMP-binding protein [SAR202 cluster bacterium]
MSYTIVGKRNVSKALEQKAQAIPDKPFIVFEDVEARAHTFTYGRFDQTVNRLTHGLRQLGVRKGDRVNVHLSNSPEFLFSWFAIAKLGAVMVPTNPLSPPDELAYPVHHSEAVLTITQPDLLANVQTMRKACPNVRNAVLCGTASPPPGILAFDKLIASQPATPPDVAIAPLDDAAILYTSGTTSRPKGVQVTHANYVFLGEAISKNVRLGPDDRHLVTLPLFHGNAQYYSIMTSLNAGASAVVIHRFSASRFFKQAIRHQCTIASLLGAPIRMILAQPFDSTDRAHKMRLAFFAMSLTEAQLAEWERRYSVPLMQLYGMTETMGQPLANPLDYTRDPMRIGFPTLGYEVRVVDEQGRDVLEGTAGQLIIRGIPGITIMKGYFKDPERTAQALRDGWLWTGDVVEVGPDGMFRFVDRAKDLIKRAGENVSAGEVEAVVKQHPAVADAAVVGVPDAMRDEAIVAFVILKDHTAVAEGDIIEFCKARLSKFRVPEAVEFRKAFPMTSTSKIQKNLLRDELIARRKK